jgi:Oxidoreductase FAD-binding domain
MIQIISKPTKVSFFGPYLRLPLSRTRFYSSKKTRQQTPPKPEAAPLQGPREISRAPAPLFLRLLAVGSTFFAFYYVWRPFDNQKNAPGAAPDFGPRTFARCIIHSVTPDPPEDGNRANHIVVHMGIPAQNLPKDGSYLTNAMHHIYIKDDDMQIERPYTPINGVGVDGKMTFWIKKYPSGEVSNWISRLFKNRNIEVRGPVQQWDWRSGSWDEIVMVRAYLSSLLDHRL